MARWSDSGSGPEAKVNGASRRTSSSDGPDVHESPSVRRNPMVRFVAIVAIAGMVLTMVGSALLLLLG